GQAVKVGVGNGEATAARQAGVGHGVSLWSGGTLIENGECGVASAVDRQWPLDPAGIANEDAAGLDVIADGPGINRHRHGGRRIEDGDISVLAAGFQDQAADAQIVDEDWAESPDDTTAFYKV